MRKANSSYYTGLELISNGYGEYSETAYKAAGYGFVGVGFLALMVALPVILFENLIIVGIEAVVFFFACAGAYTMYRFVRKIHRITDRWSHHGASKYAIKRVQILIALTGKSADELLLMPVSETIRLVDEALTDMAGQFRDKTTSLLQYKETPVLAGVVRDFDNFIMKKHEAMQDLGLDLKPPRHYLDLLKPPEPETQLSC